MRGLFHSFNHPGDRTARTLGRHGRLWRRPVRPGMISNGTPISASGRQTGQLRMLAVARTLSVQWLERLNHNGGHTVARAFLPEPENASNSHENTTPRFQAPRIAASLRIPIIIDLHQPSILSLSNGVEKTLKLCIVIAVIALFASRFRLSPVSI